MSTHPDQSNSGFFMGAVVGGVLGAMSVLLFTTKQGEKVREEAVERYQDLEAVAKKFIQAKIKKYRSKKRRS